MQGKDLKHLAAVGELSKLDFEAASVTLSSYGGNVYGVYVSAYSGAYRYIKDEDAPNFIMPLSASRFRAVAGLFRDDEYVKLVPQENALRLNGRTSTATLQEWGAASEPGEVAPPDLSDAEFAIRGAAGVLEDEFETAASFVSDTNLRPILRGIRLEANDKRMRLTSFDGFGLLYTSSVSEGMRIHQHGEIVVPSLDFMIGLRLVADQDEVVISRLRSMNAVVVYNASKSSMFRCSVLQGAWPALDSITESPMVGNRLSLSSEQIKTVAASGKAFGSAEVIMEPVGSSKVRLIVSGDEGGRYAMTIKGHVDARAVYDLAGLEKLGALGSQLELIVPSTPDFPTTAESGHRRSWLVSRG